MTSLPFENMIRPGAPEHAHRDPERGRTAPRRQAIALAAGIVAAACGLLAPAESRAQANWTGATSSNWNDPGNWDSGVPSPVVSAYINTTPRAPVIDAPVAAATVNVGNFLGATATLSIGNGGTLTSAFAFLGTDRGATGTVIVDGAESIWSNTESVSLGYFGSGHITLSNGSKMTTRTPMRVAETLSANGTLVIGAATRQAAVAPGHFHAPEIAFGAGNGQIVFNHTASAYRFDSIISGGATGTVLVENGTTLLTAANTYAGATTVDGGTLLVNGSIVSATTVNAGGTLGGNGIVGNTTIDGGTLAPGNSIGLLTVQGDLSFTSASTYMVAVSPTNADRVNVTGTATLGGATVNARFAAGSYVTRQYTILNATTGFGGTTFGSIVNTNLPSSFTSALSYDTNNVYLVLGLGYPPPPGDGARLSGNQNNVANTLADFFNRTGGIHLIFGALDAKGLTQVSGELAPGSQQTSFDAANMFIGMMIDPFAAGRGDGAPGAMPYAGDAMAYAAQKRAPTDAFASMHCKAQVAAPQERWNVWAAGFGGSQTTDGSAAAGSNNSKSSIYGMAVGADYWFSPFTVAGVSMAGGGTNFSVTGGGSGRSDLFQVGGFIRHNVGSLYASAAAAYGWQDITTDRTVTLAGFSQLRANFNANSYSGRVEVGNRFVAPWIGGIGLTPYAAFQVTAFDLPSYTESVVAGSSTFALTYAGKTALSPRSELGLRSDKSFAVNDAILTLRGRAAWAHDTNRDRSASATFQSLPGASFTVNGASLAKHTALTSASAELKWMNGWSVAGTFEGEFSEVTRSYAGKGVVRYAW